MSLPVLLGSVRGDARVVSSITIEMADLRDEQGQRIHWGPGDLLVLDFDRDDLALPPGWTGGRSEGHTIIYRWLTGKEVTATFYVPDAHVVEWRGYVLSNIQPAAINYGSVVDPT